MDFDAVSPGIVILIYILIEVAKKTFLKKDESRKHIPLVCVILGVLAGVVVYYVYPEGISAYNVMDAIATGGLSGLATTGCNQLYKQYSKYKGQTVDDKL